MASLNDDILQLRTSLERILKGLIFKLKCGDELSVSNELTWLDDKINELFRLKDRDFTRFKLLIDPKSQFVFVEPIDFSKIDFSTVRIIRETSSKDTAEDFNKDVRQYKLDFLGDIEYDILDSLISFLIKIWITSTDLRSFETANRALFVLGNLYSHVALREDPRIDFIKLYQSFSIKLVFQINELQSSRVYSQEYNSLIRYLSFHFHVSHFLNDDFPESKFEHLRKAIFNSLKSCVDSHHSDVVQGFIRSLTSDGNLAPPLYNNYSEFHSFVEDKFSELHIINDELLKKIPELGFYRPYYAFTQEDFNNLVSGLNDLKIKLFELIDDQESQKVIEDHIGKLKLYVLKSYKYRLIQRSLISVLIYALFKEEYELVDFAFDYNQPSDAAATWGNRDIVPVNLNEILSLISLKFTIDNELMFNMPDHHGALGYIDQFYLKALKHWLDRQRSDYTKELPLQLRSFTDRVEFRKNPGVLEGIISTMKDLLQKAEFYYSRYNYPFQKEDSKKEKTLTELFGIIIENLKDGLNRIESREIIARARLNSFIDKAINHFEEQSFYWNLIHKRRGLPKNEGEITEKSHIDFTIGFNQVINRSIFLENWHIPTFGTIELIGNDLSQQNDFAIERELDKILGKDKKVKPQDISSVLSESSDQDILVFKSFRVESELRQDSHFIPKWRSNEFKDDSTIIGKYKSSIVYSYQAFGLSKLIVANQHLGEIKPADSDKFTGYDRKEEFYYKIVDFGLDEAARENFMENPPSWLVDKYKTLKERNDFLAKQVWLRIYAPLRWVIPTDFSGKEYIIEK